MKDFTGAKKQIIVGEEISFITTAWSRCQLLGGITMKYIGVKKIAGMSKSLKGRYGNRKIQVNVNKDAWIAYMDKKEQ